MTFKTLVKAGKPMGFYTWADRDFIFFGTKHSDMEQIRFMFPTLKFSVLNQVHKADVLKVEGPSEGLLTGDGQWTQKENLALVIKTADCIPLMLHSPNGIAGVHAGWRGVQAQIAFSCMNLPAFKTGVPRCFIGPHIQTSSFEVGNDVAQSILASDPKKDVSAIHPHEDAQKKRVDLAKIFTHQIHHINPKADLNFVGEDTFTKPELFWSYRKKSPLVGRQFSFIARISPQDFPNWNL